jgi:hypothetical protein
MKAFVIIWIMTMTYGEISDDILVQFGGQSFWFENQAQCKQMLSEYDPTTLVDEFIAGVDPDVIFDVQIEPHCSEFDTYNHTYPEYPEFDISPENMEPELRL